MTSFKKGSLIVIVGVKSDSEGLKLHDQTLASIIEVGKYDLFVIKEKTSYRQQIFKVPKRLCEVVDLPNKPILKECNPPKVGDLVMSVVQNYTTDKIESKSGILKEVIDLTWKPKIGRLLIGTKYEEVPYDSLIILEE